MKALILLISCSLLLTNFAFAGSASFGAHGKGYEVSGCNGISNIVNNIKGYSVNFENLGEAKLEVCEEYKYETESRLETIQQLSERTEQANCFKVNIDSDKKEISIEIMSSLVTVIKNSKTVDVYTMEGHKPVVEERDRERIKHYCIIDAESVEGGVAKFLK